MSGTRWPGTPDGRWWWGDEEAKPDSAPSVRVDSSENKVKAELLDHKGNVIRRVLERESIGYRQRKNKRSK